ncbi:MAG TPA: alpha amylase [Clostridiales bacterium]|nr:alpha amylase [Clostridiales bacterium]
MLKKCTALVLASVMGAACLLSGCNGKTTEIKAEQSTDKYRNFYEIFVNSFNDSNNDGVGDLQGVIDKLDYLNDGNPNGGDDLGIDGIWFMPIMQSASYHKYNVEDYCSIDENYGTMEDFDSLLSKCKERGINVIIDLVVNHTSNSHPWFKKAVEEVKQGNLDGYARYYHIVKKEDEVAGFTYRPIAGTDYFYESNFDVTMPELNLSEPKVREELHNIMKFWLDKGVSGFRLDAVKYFGSGGDDGKDFLTWMYSDAQSIKDDVYMVGEEWAGKSEISDYYDTGVDSFFNFPYAGADGKFESVVRSGGVVSLINGLKDWDNILKKHNENAIDAPFLSNHDTTRSAVSLGKTDLVAQKTAAMLYMLSPGNSFTYYGEEIGLLGNTGSDASFRIPMPWVGGECENITIPNLSVEDAKAASQTTVEDAIADSNSLFHFYQQIIKLKLQNPEIQRGTIGNIYEGDTSATAGYITTYKDSSVIIVYNLNDADATINITKEDLNYSGIAGQATAQNPDNDGKYPQATLDGTKVKIPSKTVVILK